MSGRDMMLHRCGPACQQHGLASPRPRAKRVRPIAESVIDVHCHALSQATEKLVADTPQKKSEPHLMLRAQGQESIDHNRSVMLPNAIPKLLNLEQRLSDMDDMGVDIQLVSPSPTQYYYWANPDLAVAITTQINDDIAALIARAPDRLLGLGTVALQHPELAARQLRTLMTIQGLKGVQISASVNEVELSDPALDPFWEVADELGAVVFIHPSGSSLMERLDKFYLANIIGQPIETTIALSHLIFGGVLDRNPALKILAAHGGGYLPFYPGRSMHGNAMRPEAQKMRHAPEVYFKRIWFDNLVYDAAQLCALIDRVGVSQLVLGTDYPFDMGDYRCSSFLEQIDTLTVADRRDILCGNARRLIGDV
jgi:aminocarboxymuconate-semialdehyde decarboxylase